MKVHVVKQGSVWKAVLALALSAAALAIAGAAQSQAGVIGSDLTRAPGNNDPSYKQCSGSEYWDDDYYYEEDCGYYTDWYAVGNEYDTTYIVAAAPGGQVAVTAPGIATKGRVRTNGPRTVNVQIVRPDGGLVYKIVGESGFQAVGAGISELPMRVSVQPGDMVAVSAAKQDVSKASPASFESRTPGAFAYVRDGTPVPAGVSATYKEENKTEPLVQASVEGDADGDGFGDETQDPDTDNDGLTNDIEAKWGTNSYDVDSDDDGLRDGDEDKNKNGKLDNYNRVNNANTCKKPRKGKKRSKKATVAKKKKKGKKGKKSGKFKPFKKKSLAKIETSPKKADTDGDKLPDGLEQGAVAPIPVAGAILGTDKPIKPDAHPSSVTNPRAKDTDGDKTKDGREDRNRDGKVNRKKRETNPNGPDCGKKKRGKKRKRR